jgi:hypothetical protein
MSSKSRKNGKNAKPVLLALLYLIILGTNACACEITCLPLLEIILYLSLFI